MNPNQTQAQQLCPKCGRAMESVGLKDDRLLLSSPPQWDEVYVCHRDRLKRIVRRHGAMEPTPLSTEGYEVVP